jgi:hypothetical protein
VQSHKGSLVAVRFVGCVIRSTSGQPLMSTDERRTPHLVLRLRAVVAFRGPLEVIIWVVAAAGFAASLFSPMHGLFLTASLVLLLALAAIRRHGDQGRDR